MDAELFAQEQRRDKTRSLKTSMMQKLLTGPNRLFQKSAVEYGVTLSAKYATHSATKLMLKYPTP
jgi:hypothetical protein